MLDVILSFKNIMPTKSSVRILSQKVILSKETLQVMKTILSLKN